MDSVLGSDGDLPLVVGGGASWQEMGSILRFDEGPLVAAAVPWFG